MKFAPLSSGSCQNCYYIESGESAILIDMGLSYARLAEFIALTGGDMSRVKALFVTHEHWDHIKGLRSFVKNLDVPVFLHESSRREARLKLQNHCELRAGRPETVDGLEVLPFPVSHDARNTFGFRIQADGRTLFLAADMGVADGVAVEHARNAHVIAVESNYDPQMLQRSPYPAHLKRRIRGPEGHLSNPESADFLSKTISWNTHQVFMLHLSENNNSRETVSKMVNEKLAGQYPLVGFHVTYRDRPMEMTAV